MEDELMSVEQAALMLGTSSGSIYRLIRQEILQAVKVSENIPVWRFTTKVRKSSVEQYMANRDNAMVEIER
jgi:excisionase family DNA binding protein